MAIIETQDLRKHFKMRRGVVEAVRGVDLQVPEGAIFGFLGPNGAGKTTTLRLLATLLTPDGGRAVVAGHDLRREPARVRERIGYVSQPGGVDQAASGRANLVLQARLYGLAKAEAVARTDHWLRLLELEAFADRRASSYSGGQRRRLDLALGMIHQPALLFLDEPTAGLDPQSRARLWDEVRRLRAEGASIFLTTHYLEEADALCDRLAIIDHGQIVAEGSPDELKRQVAGDIVTLGVDSPRGVQELLRAEPFVRELEVADDQLRLTVARGEEALPEILRVLTDAKVGLRTIALARPSLDDVFLRQTGYSLRDEPEAALAIAGGK